MSTTDDTIYTWEHFPAPGGGFYSWRDATRGQAVEFKFEKLIPATAFEDDDPDILIPEMHGTDRNDNPVILSCRPVILRRKMIELAPELGSWLRVTFMGKQGRANDFEVHLVEGPGTEPF